MQITLLLGVLLLTGCAVAPVVYDYQPLKLRVIKASPTDVKKACEDDDVVCCCENCQPGHKGTSIIWISWRNLWCIAHELCHWAFWDPDHKKECRPDGDYEW